MGNKAISLKNCRNVVLRDFAILHGGHFGILATGVDNLTVDNLQIDTNRDGIDIDCCRNVRVSNCAVNSPWDDGICLKSSYGLGSAKPTEMVTITNCYVAGCFEEGTLLDATYKRFAPGVRVPHTGRIKFGTESNGGFRNITISNCVFEGCQGLALETVDGALLEDVTITNISMRDIVSAPIFLRLGSRMRGPEGAPVGTLRRVTISNLVCSNAVPRFGSIISGIPGHPIEDVKLSNIQVLHQGGGTKEDAAIKPPERENAYPEPTMFGTMPSHGFFIRHVKGIELSHIEIGCMKEDARPAFVLEDVQGADFSHIKTPHPPDVPTFALRNVQDFDVHQSRPVPNAVPRPRGAEDALIAITPRASPPARLGLRGEPLGGPPIQVAGGVHQDGGVDAVAAHAFAVNREAVGGFQAHGDLRQRLRGRRHPRPVPVAAGVHPDDVRKNAAGVRRIVRKLDLAGIRAADLDAHHARELACVGLRVVELRCLGRRPVHLGLPGVGGKLRQQLDLHRAGLPDEIRQRHPVFDRRLVRGPQLARQGSAIDGFAGHRRGSESQRHQARPQHFDARLRRWAGSPRGALLAAIGTKFAAMRWPDSSSSSSATAPTKGRSPGSGSSRSGCLITR